MVVYEFVHIRLYQYQSEGVVRQRMIVHGINYRLTSCSTILPQCQQFYLNAYIHNITYHTNMIPAQTTTQYHTSNQHIKFLTFGFLRPPARNEHLKYVERTLAGHLTIRYDGTFQHILTVRRNMDTDREHLIATLSPHLPYNDEERNAYDRVVCAWHFTQHPKFADSQRV